MCSLCLSDKEYLTPSSMSHALVQRRCLVISILPKDYLEPGRCAGGLGVEALGERIRERFPGEFEVQWHESCVRPTGDEDGEEAGGEGLLMCCSVPESILPSNPPGAGEEALLAAIRAHAPEGSIAAAEVWLTAPGVVPLARVSLRDVTVAGDGERERAAGLMKRLGIVCMEGAVPLADVERLREAAGKRVAEAEAALAAGHPDIRVGETLFAFKEISSRGKQRFDLLLDPGGDAVNDLVRGGPWVGLVRELLGEEGECEASLVYSRPGAEDQEWHTDGAHLGRRAEWGAAECTRPYAICVFLALSPLSEEVGFTQFWPGSHRSDGLAGFGGASVAMGTCLDAIVEAPGGCVVYDYRLMHRGMPNMSGGTQRDILQLVYHATWYEERKNYGAEPLFA